MTTTTDQKRNPAGQALFDMQFGFMMLNCGRVEEANVHFERAEQTLAQLEKDLDKEEEDQQ